MDININKKLLKLYLPNIDEVILDYREDQQLIHKLLQQDCCEELIEAVKVIEQESSEPQHMNHLYEEIIDAFNFTQSYFILRGSPLNIISTEDFAALDIDMNYATLRYIKDQILTIIEDIHWLCNLLKSRTWSEEEYLVDYKEYEKRENRLKKDWLYLLYKFNYQKLVDTHKSKCHKNMLRVETHY